MKFHIVLSTAAAVMIVVHTAAADEPINDLPLEQREAYAEQALDFVQCAGMHHAAGDVGREVGAHPDEIELAEGLGRGWSLAAQMLVALAMPDPTQAGPYAQDQIEAARTEWRARLRGAGNPLVKEWAERCLELSELQKALIQAMRKGALTQ